MDNFDLKKYLVENKVTTNSRMMNEENTYSIDLATIKELLKHSTVLKSHANAKGGPTIPEIESFIDKNHNSGKFLWWYSEPGEETGLQELSPEVALETAKAIETLSPVPEGVVSGFASSLHYVENPVDSKKLTSVTKYPTATKMMKESETPDSVSMMVFLEGLGINPKDPLFTSAIKSGNVEEIIALLVDTAGNGDAQHPFDGVYTQSDFAQAARAAQFSEEMVDDLLDMDEIRTLERG
jgi:hypothetical protein